MKYIGYGGIWLDYIGQLNFKCRYRAIQNDNSINKDKKEVQRLITIRFTLWVSCFLKLFSITVAMIQCLTPQREFMNTERHIKEISLIVVRTVKKCHLFFHMQSFQADYVDNHSKENEWKLQGFSFKNIQTFLCHFNVIHNVNLNVTFLPTWAYYLFFWQPLCQ